MHAENADRYPTRRFGALRSAAKLSAILLASALLMPLQWAVLRFTRGPAAFVLPRWWFACLRRALRIRVEVVGTPRDGGGTVFVGNHVSHFDIPLLGSVLRARFIAKDDMAGWPGMRFVGGLGQILFISRRSRDAASVASMVAAQMRPDQNLVLFAEGTTSSGATVAPFKSSLFSLFLDRPGSEASGDSGAAANWMLQPFTIDIVSVDGGPLADGGDRNGYAFYGDMDAGAHVQRFLRSSGACVRVIFHPPIAVAPDDDRKALAAQVHAVVASGLSCRTA